MNHISQFVSNVPQTADNNYENAYDSIGNEPTFVPDEKYPDDEDVELPAHQVKEELQPWQDFEKSIQQESSWLDIDPITSLNAMNIKSWKQEIDIKLLIRLRLQTRNLKFDYGLKQNLENFLKMK